MIAGSGTADTDGNGNRVILLVDLTYLVTVHPAPGRDIVEYARVSAQDPE
jgi:hypothetical protein